MASEVRLRIVAGIDARTERAIADDIHPQLPLDASAIAALHRQADLAAGAVMRSADFDAIAQIIARQTGADEITALIAATKIASYIATGK